MAVDWILFYITLLLAPICGQPSKWDQFLSKTILLYPVSGHSTLEGDTLISIVLICAFWLYSLKQYSDKGDMVFMSWHQGEQSLFHSELFTKRLPFVKQCQDRYEVNTKACNNNMYVTLPSVCRYTHRGTHSSLKWASWHLGLIL